MQRLLPGCSCMPRILGPWFGNPESQARVQVREALAAKHVIRVCSAAESDRVAAAARRLLENALAIRQSVDLSGAASM